MQKKTNPLLVCFLFVSVLSSSVCYAVNRTSRLYSKMDIQSVGLTRAWFSQVSMTVGLEKIKHVTLQDGTLFVVTDHGNVQAFDTINGTCLWKQRLGDESFYTHAVAANSKVAAVVNGTTLYILDRFQGKRLFEKSLNGEPSAGPQISERSVFVPMTSQKMFAFSMTTAQPEKSVDQSLEEATAEIKKIFAEPSQEQDASASSPDQPQSTPNAPPQTADSAASTSLTQNPYRFLLPDEITTQSCPLLGFAINQPVLSTQTPLNDYICWTTNRGWLMIGQLNYAEHITNDNALNLLYRVAVAPETLYLNSKRIGQHQLEQKNNIEARPLYLPEDISYQNMNPEGKGPQGGLILIGSDLGYVFAVNDMTGDVRWRFLTGTPVTEQIVADKQHCFIATHLKKLYCVELKNGVEKWEQSGIQRTVALSETCIYAIDKNRDLLILAKEDGRYLGKLRLDNQTSVIINQESDRLFFVSEDGLIQCLHEIQLNEPIKFRSTCAEINRTLSSYSDDASNTTDATNNAANEAAQTPPVSATPASAADPSDADNSDETQNSFDEMEEEDLNDDASFIDDESALEEEESQESAFSDAEEEDTAIEEETEPNPFEDDF